MVDKSTAKPETTVVDPVPESVPQPLPPPPSRGFGTAVRTNAGFLLLLFALLIVFGVYGYVKDHDIRQFSTFEFWIVAVMMFVALGAALIGVKTMVNDTSTPRIVIPPADRALLEQLIRDGNDKGIDQYVRLSSLSGTTGTATKLGLTGLPLATVGLTVFFAVIAIFKVEGFLDLAKLTLGAFIGSFVQRNVTAEKIIGKVDKAS